jgi:DNA recombination protein RmuC
MDILSLVFAFFLGAGLAFIFLLIVNKSKHESTNRAIDLLKKENTELSIDNKVKEDAIANLRSGEVELKTDLEEERNKIIELSRQLSGKESDYKNLLERLKDQKEEIEKSQEKYSIAFKNLANEIFEEKSKKFTDQNKINLKDILTPLKERIVEFEKKVEQTNKDSIERNSALKEQIISLKELNIQITKEAENLTKALKGESKTQGNWGEFILEKILEKSGLIKGQHYDVQVSMTNNEGKRVLPDIIINLPENKSIIIDSKVSLIAYERLVNEEDTLIREKLIKEHLLSIRTHIKGLGEKNYQMLYELGSLDFVLLFMPIEPAFSIAVQNDPELFSDAYEKNIVIVSPTTLIATLRTISSIWRQEQQNKNALEIARQSGLLYDKFTSFSDDLIVVGQNLKTTTKNYDQAMNKLVHGKDNLVSKTERLRTLGAKTSKVIDQRLLDRSEE